MKLSPTQIEQLYAFTRQHFVEYYDLQTELVDHLANAIEAKWAENPALSFDEILNAEFKKFGVFGFMDVVEKRQAALTRKYNKIVWENFRDFFEFPKVVLVVISFYLISLGLQTIQYASEIYVVIFGLLTLFLLIKTSVASFRRRKKSPEEKKWLFEEIISRYGGIMAFFVLPIQLLNAFSRNAETIADTNKLLYGFSAFLVVYVISIYVIAVKIPSKAKEYLAQTYPEMALMRE